METTIINKNTDTSVNKFTLWIMAIATGACVANLYYCQPLLHQMQESFNVTPAQIGSIPTLTQFGYGIGILFLIPLGDRYEKRSLIVLSTFISALALIALTFTNSILLASLVSFLIGVTTMTPQFIIPFSMQLANDSNRGRILGMVMSGLLLGILLARTVAGFVGAEYGWKFMFNSAGIFLIGLSILLRFTLPVAPITYSGNYFSLLKSVWGYVKEQSVLRESMLFGSMLFGAFCAFWATLIYLMESPAFHLGARAVGIFGLLGAAGALTAPIVGRLADKKSPRTTIRFGYILMAISFFIYLIWGSTSLIALAIGVLVMDVGLQGTHVANQSRIFALIPEARSRLNTAYMFSYFMGGALGSWVSSYAWSKYQWSGVCVSALILIAIGSIPFFLQKKNGQH